MSKASAIFSFQGVDILIQCSKEDIMKDICQKFANKIKRNVNSLIFLYGGNNLNFHLSFKDQANIIDKERNEMNILVYKNENDLQCPKCGEKINLNTEKINDIKLSIKNIDDTVRGAKLMIENIIKICTIDIVNIQLKNVNVIFNNLNEDIKKLNNKFDDLLNVKYINKDFNNYIIAEIDIKDEDINKNIRILNSYEEVLRTNPGKYESEDIYKNENEIKKCEIKIDDNIIPFNYYHKFKTKGKHIIKYSFKTNLKRLCSMFSDCKLLKSINLSNFNTNNVTIMSGMFQGCSSLKDINLSNFNTNNVTNMNYMFGDCSSLNRNKIIIKDKRIFNNKTLFEKLN